MQQEKHLLENVFWTDVDGIWFQSMMDFSWVRLAKCLINGLFLFRLVFESLLGLQFHVNLKMFPQRRGLDLAGGLSSVG